MRRIARWGGLILTVAAAWVAGAGVYLGEITLRLPRKALPADIAAWGEAVEIRAEDGLRLRGSWMPAVAKDAVIVLHGQTDNRTGAMGVARLFLREGFHALVPDLRGHGASDGVLVTYGFWEAGDVRRWAAWLVETKGVRNVFGFGESMGGAILLQALAGDSRFRAVVVEAPFCTFREITYDRISTRYKAGPWPGRTFLRPAVEVAFLYDRLRYRVDLERVAPEEAVARTRVPVLLIYGTRDANTPERHARRILERGPTVTAWEIGDAGHTGAYASRPAEFERRVVEWFHGR